MRRKPRGLRSDELEMWRRVADATIPMHARVTPKASRPVHHKPAPVKHPPIASFRVGEKSPPPIVKHVQSLPISDHLRTLAPVMDRKTFTKMNKGKLKPEARIDLHGFTLAQAHPALHRFITTQHIKGARLVLVITGKGKPKKTQSFFFEQQGALRNQVPHWLTTPPLHNMVMEIRPAHLRHGGDGAYYVYLRRSR